MFCKNCGNKIKNGIKFCTNCGHVTTHGDIDVSEKVVKIPASALKHFLKNILVKLKENTKTTISWVILVVIIIIALLLNHNNKTVSKNINMNDNTKSVVNIWCDNDQGGSGTIFTTDGIVLTNNHVINGSTLCKITIPNLLTGGIEEIYEATSIIVPKLSEKYDVATLKINAAYTDLDGKIWGTYPATFSPFILPKTCDVGQPSRLGDSVRIYGYPVTSGGFNLTITDGIISSFTNDGDILTSAQIDSGNSGGLAIDQNGCWLGMPSAVVSGDYQNLGVIIPGNIIQVFLLDVPVKLNPSSENTNSVSEAAINPEETNEQRCQNEFGINSTWSGEMDKKDSPLCMCQIGYSWDATGSVCVTKKSLKQECQNSFGKGAYSLTENGKAVCDCLTGYKWNSSDTTCVVIPSISLVSGCTTTVGYSATTGLSCSGNGSCASASFLDTNTDKCIETASLTNNQLCNQKFNNSYSTANSDGSNSCSCKSGYYWDNNAVGQDGNCFTTAELNQACNKSLTGTHWDGTYGSNGIYVCAY